MTKDAYKAAYEKAKEDLKVARRHRDHWNIETARLEQLVKSLAATLELPETLRKLGTALAEVGFTELVLSTLGNSADGMTAVEVRDELQKRGYNFGNRANPLALIHQTLKRLAVQDKVRERNGRYKRIFPFFGEY